MLAERAKTVWPGWQTVRMVGRGGFGTVYEIQRDVFGHKEKAALKVISIPKSESDIEELLGDGYDKESITRRFEGFLHDIVREYSLMVEMKGCANIVYCDDVKYTQHDDGMGWDIFIKMELLTPLLKVVDNSVSDSQVIKLGMDICNALAFCEKRNVLHRDIKPQNIFVSSDGTYKLGDFGIAKTAERTTSGTKTGTYKYMAPEVYNNQPYGCKADIYSFGMLLYWLLNERRTPFLPLPPEMPTASDENKALNKRFSGALIPAPRHGSPALKKIVLKACAYKPEDRYQNAAEMLKDLSKLSGAAEKTDSNDSSSSMTSRHSKTKKIKADHDDDKNEDDTLVGRDSKSGKDGTDKKIDKKHQTDENTVSDGQSDEGRSKKKAAIITALLLTCVLAAVLLIFRLSPGQTDNSDAAMTEGNSGVWVPVKTTDYFKGELTRRVDYKYGEQGTSDIYYVFYNTYNGTETRQHTVMEKDSEGVSTRNTTYDEKTGEIVSYTEFIRNKNGEIIQSNTYSADGTLLSSDEHCLEEELRNTVAETYRYENGEKFVDIATEYDSRGKVIKRTNYDTDGSPYFVTEYSYDNSGIETKRVTTYYLLGQLNEIRETVLKYDDNGVLIQDISTSLGTGEITIGEYTYDQHGNQIRYVSTCNGEEISRTETEYRLYKDGALVDDDISANDISQLNIMDGQRIVVHRNWVLGLKDDGTVLAAGGDNLWGSNMAVAWKDIIAIDAAVNGSKKNVLGLKNDGTVVAAGWNLNGECDVSEWSDIVQIEAVINTSYGLKADGTIVAAGSNRYGDCNVENITNGAKMYAQEHSSNCLLVLNKDGTVEATGGQSRFTHTRLPYFENINDLFLGWDKLYGVTDDGRVVSDGKLPLDISRWTDVKKVYSTEVVGGLIIALREDGTVLAYSEKNYYNEEEIFNAVREWTDIRDIVILLDFSDFEKYTVIGVKNDGSVVSSGGIDLTGFDNIAELYVYDDDYTKFAYLVGVRYDGSVISNDPAVADTVANWDLF